MEKRKNAVVTESGYEDRKLVKPDSGGKFAEEVVRAKEYKVAVRNLGGTINIMFKQKDNYTAVRIDDKDVMVFIGENRKGNRWLTEFNNEVKSHAGRREAEEYIGKKIVDSVEYLGLKANHIYDMSKEKEYQDGKILELMYGDLCLTRIDQVGEVYSVSVLGRSVWVYDTKERALQEAKKYFIRYYVERDFIESPWGNYMGTYREIIEQYTQKLIDRGRFEDEKRNLWGSGKQSKTGTNFFREESGDGKSNVYMLVMLEACLEIGKYYVAEMFGKDFPRIKALSVLHDIQNGMDDEDGKKRVGELVENFDAIKKVVQERIKKGKKENK